MQELRLLQATELQPPLNVTFIRDIAGLDKLQDFFSRCGYAVGWDIETDPKRDYFYRRIRTCQFGNTKEQYVVDLRDIFGGADALFEQQGYYGVKLEHTPALTRFLEVVKPVVCSRDYLKVGVNLGFEYLSFYWCLGLRTFNYFDNSIVERVIWAGAHSLKDYGFYSMEEMMGRYYQLQIDKSLQESFTLDLDLTPDQIAYAALDTRFPHGLMNIQNLILQGYTLDYLKKKNSPYVQMFERIDPLVVGDNLTATAALENNVIGAFQDMKVHGERLDREKWLERIGRRKQELARVIREELDPHILPIVGSKHTNYTDEQIAKAEDAWKALRAIPEAETKLKGEVRKFLKTDPAKAAELEAQRAKMEADRKLEKERLKTICGDMKKRRTAVKNLAADCEGEALLNYGSNAQVLKVFKGIRGLGKLADTDDDSLEKFKHIPVIAGFRNYRTLSKEIGTYGEQWAREWVTGPCKEEGWLHPGDGRLHCEFNQYDAETGRSTSEKPNAQNLPKEKEVRACFIADPPDEFIRISVCCDADTQFKFNNGNGAYVCTECRSICETKAEEYVMVTADMSGAELRILADLANDPVWIGAFNRGEDVHSVCTELIEGDRWFTLALPDCAYFKLKPDGTAQRKKCKCPEHNELRDGMKPTNFGLPYGISDRALAPQIGKSLEDTQKLMAKHKVKFPSIWMYIDAAGKKARICRRAFDMFGRRRLFPEATDARAIAKAKEDCEERLRYPVTLEEAKERFTKMNQREPSERECKFLDCAETKIAAFIAQHGRKPLQLEKWPLTHREPNINEIARARFGLENGVERQGKNHEIQGTNASIAKVAMGSGYCPAGKPYLWHTLPQYKAKLLKMVHDELVVQAPKRFAQKVADLIGDAFKRAAAERMTKVTMEFEYNIATFWKK